MTSGQGIKHLGGFGLIVITYYDSEDCIIGIPGIHDIHRLLICIFVDIGDNYYLFVSSNNGAGFFERIQGCIKPDLDKFVRSPSANLMLDAVVMIRS